LKFTTDGLVIKENNVGESDRVIVILTRDKGLISAFVTGARKPKSKNAASTALLAYSSFTITKTKDTYRITEAESREVFFGIRQDIERLSLSQYICELCQVLVPYEVESENLLRLALNTLHFLAQNKKDIYTLKAIIELRMMTIAGFMPDLLGCKMCGSDQNFPLFMDVLGGEIVCGNCKTTGDISGSFLELDKTTFAAMRHLVYSDLERLFSFSLPIEHAKYLSFVTERYLLAQTEHRFKTLDFFHSLETTL
jgi:DNA repair protein RecO (recombination protein O)